MHCINIHTCINICLEIFRSRKNYIKNTKHIVVNCGFKKHKTHCGFKRHKMILFWLCHFLRMGNIDFSIVSCFNRL
jgi:hypothetical protein